MTNLGRGSQTSPYTYAPNQNSQNRRVADKLALVKTKPSGPYVFEGDIDGLVAELQPTIPLYVIRPDILARQAQAFVQGFRGTTMYAVKVNPDKHVVQALYKAGIRTFDVASIEEVRLVRRLAPKGTMYFMHPVKAREAISEAYFMHGVHNFVLDTQDELNKILQETAYAPDLTLMVRLAVKGEDAIFALSDKFGASVQDVADLLAMARPVAAKIGVTFHVGSQCMDPAAYRRALQLAQEAVHLSGVKIDVVDVGGGFPVSYPDMEPVALTDYFTEIERALNACGFADCEHFCEPGRALVAEAGSMVARVELRKGNMLYLNDGTYGGLFDAGKQFNFRFGTRRVGKQPGEGETPFCFSGPTCDSVDMMKGPFMLPDDVAEGDWIEIKGMGAYSLSVRSNFNGFGRSATVFLKETR
ncbi:MAG: type III PLP-dependent enzyme [Alphaproteobacteria bacterium]|nr:type III PLP-dependent enzyme [Alphaproteobacteria bacterium]